MLTEDDWLLLARAPGVGAVAWGALMRDEVPAPEVAARLDALRTPGAQARLQDLHRRCDRCGVTILTPAAPEWPERLTVLDDPPAVLFLRGDPSLLSMPQIAVVGARRASRRGLADVAWLVPELVGAGLAVTSGLALGIDGAAHRAALDAGGTTLAVLGSGPDRIHPASHRQLAGRIIEAGLLVSEFPPGTRPAPHHFPRRNRIISGLALGTVVVEAGARSGSMITARLAAAQGREVFALPATARDPNAAGCLRLIRDGAVLVRGAGDILDELGWSPAPSPGAPAAAGETPAGRGDATPPEAMRILDAIDPEGTVFDLVAARTGLEARDLGIALTELELEGLLARQADRLVRLDR